MRQHEKYLEKVTEESDVFRRHLIRGDELSPQQEETFGKIDTMRGWLRQGFSDADVIKLSKTDPRIKVADRRARELLTMAYDIFADLRSARNTDGVKYLYAEQFRTAARLVMEKIETMIGIPESQDMNILGLTLNMETSQIKEVTLLLKEYRGLLKEAAEIDGAYKETPKKEKTARSQKFVIKRKKTKTSTRIDENGNLISETDELEAKYEQ